MPPNIDNDSSAVDTHLSEFESLIKLDVEKLSARISVQDQIIDANKQELYRLSSENLHLKSRILNLEETVLSLNKISIKKACTEKSNRNKCSVTEIVNHSYNNLSFEAPVQVVKQNKAISKIMVQNGNLNIDKLNAISANENNYAPKNFAPKIPQKAPHVHGNNTAPEISVQSQLRKSNISKKVPNVNQNDSNNKFNRYSHQQHFYQSNNESNYDSDQKQTI